MHMLVEKRAVLYLEQHLGYALSIELEEKKDLQHYAVWGGDFVVRRLWVSLKS